MLQATMHSSESSRDRDLIRAIEEWFKGAQYQRCIDLCASALNSGGAQSQVKPALLLLRSQSNYELRNFDDAIKDAEQVVALQPFNSEGWKMHGYASYASFNMARRQMNMRHSKSKIVSILHSAI